ncbi:hypothetical protein KSC_010390 [Ktedonobacter sp. SOSP1-52]|uniref:hypothetical protein n=1 Tax=Ktedonobacter sp. SOSP1-52 TaxID=2778366 RepID=UPI0019158A64|nr:hypothetical protein [Ktedonobacter sp. SOSP1-52]GHO62147.1 hypothetical protein KSC_010390 [Ktedonobacter sp. SOSP1-52]
MRRSVQPRSHLDSIGVGIGALTLLTALAHLYLGMQPDEELWAWFLLNGLGYLVLLVLFFLPQLATIHAVVRWTLLGYTLLTFILWFFLGSPSQGELDPFDLTVKAAEAILIIFLLVDSSYHST